MLYKCYFKHIYSEEEEKEEEAFVNTMYFFVCVAVNMKLSGHIISIHFSPVGKVVTLNF